MNQHVKIRLAKNDTILKAWRSYLLERGYNISRMVVLAIYFYAKTGEYVEIGTVSVEQIEQSCIKENDNFTVYLPNGKWFEEWNKGVLEKNAKLSSEIKRILKGGLTPSSHTEIISLEELEKRIDQLADTRNREPLVLKQSVQPVKVRVPENDRESDKIPEDSKETTEKEQKQPRQKIEENAMDRLFMGMGFSN